MATISTTITNKTVTLSSSGTYGSPLTISSGGYIDNTNGIALDSPGAGANYYVNNQGRIKASGAYSDAIVFQAGGTIVNSGTISGTYFGIQVSTGITTVINSGTITSTNHYSYGIRIHSGYISNSSAGYIHGNHEGVSGDAPAPVTLVNAGRITGGSYSNGAAVQLFGGGVLTNSGTISDASAYGVRLNNATTVTNSGTIIGGGGKAALAFLGTGGNLLVLEDGYSLVGGVSVAGTANALELAGATGAVTVAFDKVGGGFTNFGTAAFGAASGNDLTLEISDTMALPGTITNFNTFHDIVDLTQFTNPGAAVVNFNTATDQLTVTEGTQSVTLQLDNENYTGVSWTPGPDGGTGTDISAACFCRGTRILTATGVVAVEDLAIGDRVVTLSGEGKPIRWIGRRGYAGRFIAGNRAVLPVRVMEGALADGVPARELWVSPEHALYLDGALVPAGLLVNGASIVQAEEVDEVEYFHIELDRHDVILADGAPAESFVDDDSRGVFHNAAEFYALYPHAPAWVPAYYCAPRLEAGFQLEALRRRLLGRARRLGAGGTAPPGVLRGLLERVDRARIAGWAFDPASPDTPVGLVVLANGAEIGRVVADRYRRDLAEAGIGRGHHGFELVVPGGLSPRVRHEIEVCREADWSLLPGSPAVLEPIASGLERNSPPRPAAAPPSLSTLRGYIDIAERTRIAGWAQDSADPERRIGLVVTVNDDVIGRVLANGYRGDLEADGIGDGRHAFELLVPPAVRNRLPGLQAWEIRVEREADGTELPGSPLSLPAASGFDAATEEIFAGILAGAAAGAAGDASEDRALAFLTEQADRLLARRAERHGRHAEREAHRLFRRRWGSRGENGQGENGSERSTPPHLRALVVDRQVPCTQRDAGSVAILSHVRALRELGYEVSFAASDEMDDAAGLARLSAAEGIATCGGPYYSCVEEVLARQAGGFDLVYLHRPENADRYLPLVRRYSPKALILYSVADLHHLRLARQAKVEGRPELLAHSRYLAAIEMMAARRADLVITHSPVEAELLRREIGFGKVHVVPFAVASRPPRRRFGERHGIAILGSFGHAPNPDAVHYLVRDILPRVWARDPTLTCKIVGHGWNPGRLPRLDPRIEMIGEVADLDDVFDTVRLTVAPLRFGAGIKGKVLDSFAAGLPCVMTPTAAEGLTLTGALPQLVSDDPAELAELIVRLHTDAAANDEASLEAARMAAQQFSAERVVEGLREILKISSSNPGSIDHRLSGTTEMTAIA